MAKGMKICGVVEKTGGVLKYDAQGVFVGDKPDRVALGSYVNLSNPGAKRLAAALGVPLPRRGQAVRLCGEQYLERTSDGAQFRVNRRAPGGFEGAKKRRRR